ncbi:MAG: PilX N-terminal domain-containing pilus assembly protein [Granulosicoccus sp.]
MRHLTGNPVYAPRTFQQGIALVTSLILLAAMTILGVATLSGTRLNEQIASNTQQKSIAFEAAESAIESVFNYNDLYAAITSDTQTTAANPPVVTLADTKSKLGQGYDMLDNEGKGIDIEGALTVQFCGEMQPIGTSLNAALDSGQMTAVLVDINSVVSIANSGARADHIRRVQFQVPQTGRTGNCPQL